MSEKAMPKSAMGCVRLVSISAKKKSLNLTKPKGAIEIWYKDFKSWNLAFLKKHGIQGYIHIKRNIKNETVVTTVINLVYD